MNKEKSLMDLAQELEEALREFQAQKAEAARIVSLSYSLIFALDTALTQKS